MLIQVVMFFLTVKENSFAQQTENYPALFKEPNVLSADSCGEYLNISVICVKLLHQLQLLSFTIAAPMNYQDV